MNTIQVAVFAVLLFHRINGEGSCVDVDSDACKLMEHNKPDLCNSSIGDTACPRYCGKCPIQCYSCSDLVKDLSQCSEVVTCDLNQTCYSMEVFDFDQSHGFRGGCISKELCVPHRGQPQIFGRSSSTVKAGCCDSDKCNGQMSVATTTTITTARATTSTTTPTQSQVHGSGSHCVDYEPHVICSLKVYSCNAIPFKCQKSCGLCWKIMEFSDSKELDRVNERNTREHSPVIVFIAVIIMVGIIMNIFATIFYCCKVKKSAFQIFMFCLSFNDLITNVVYIERIVELFYNVEYRSSALCKLFFVLRHFFAGNSLLLMVAIGFDRYRQVCFPFSKQIAFRVVWCIMFGLIALSLAVSVRYFVTAGIVVIDIKTENNATVEGHYCLLSLKQNSISTERVFHFIDICTHGIITFLLVFFYSLVVRKLIKSRQKVNANKNMKLAMQVEEDSSNDCPENPGIHDFEMCASQRANCNSSISDFSETQTLSRKSFAILRLEPHFSCKKESNVSKVAELSDELSTYKFTSVSTASKTNECDTGKSKTFVKDKQKPSHFASSKILQRRLFVSRLEKRMAIMAAVITVVSFVCFVPYYVSALTQSFDFTGNGLLLNADVLIARNAYIVNSAINPFIILGFSVAFKRFVVNTFCLFYSKRNEKNG